jgi:protein-S-isoprenylcysteine O-methyltransferase Ste14
LVSRWVNITLGMVLILLGIPLFIMSGIMVHTHISKGKLCTTGVYAYFRHPLYAAWVVFITPGIAIITGSIVAISWPIFLYVLFKIFTVEEEAYLRRKFGDDYLRYEREVNAVFPKIWQRYNNRLERQ